ncbi:MAG: glycerate kinase type-2 family protein [Halothiobacillaceae bacterium]|jgi:hydroxypyruvate reductase
MRACQILRLVLDAALHAVDGRVVVIEALRQRRGMFAGIVAIGKAASSMLEGALLLQPDAPALLITKDGHVPPRLRSHLGVEVREAGHPLPDARSLAAGQRLLEFIAASPQQRPLLFLLSGGASSLVEVLPTGVTLEDWRRVNAWLLASGLDIHAMNAVRKRLSCIKGGRLLEHLEGRRAAVLMISDVPRDDPASIGSGPLVPSPEVPLPGSLPDWIERLLATAPPSPAPEDGRWRQVESHIVATNGMALDGAEQAAMGLGVPIHCHAEFLQGDAAEVGERLARWLMDAAPPGLHLWGGETTVRLPPESGRGGRNQHLALSAALALDGTTGITLLAAGSDGTDGPTAEAGGCVDGGAAALIRAHGVDPEEALRRADSGGALAVADALIHTGPTGTNVMDVVLALKMA